MRYPRLESLFVEEQKICSHHMMQRIRPGIIIGHSLEVP